MDSYGKLVNGKLEKAPDMCEEKNGTQHIPPGKDWLKENGYLEIVYTPAPEPKEDYVYIAGWEEKDGKIIRTWTEEHIEPTPDPIDAILETLDYILENM